MVSRSGDQPVRNDIYKLKMLKSILIFEQYVGYWLSIVVIHFSMRTVIEFHSSESRIATSERNFVRDFIVPPPLWVVITGAELGRFLLRECLGLVYTERQLAISLWLNCLDFWKTKRVAPSMGCKPNWSSGRTATETSCSWTCKG